MNRKQIELNEMNCRYPNILIISNVETNHLPNLRKACYNDSAYYRSTGLGFFLSNPALNFKLPINRLIDVVLDVIGGGGGGAYGGGTKRKDCCNQIWESKFCIIFKCM